MVTKSIPAWLASYINSNEIESLAQKVGQLEKDTSVEFVTMVVEKSSVTRHVFWMLTILLFASFMHLHVFAWGEFYPSQQSLFYLLEFLSSALLAKLLEASFGKALTRLLTDDRDLAQQVQMRAEIEFHRQRLTETNGNTGILIFVSMLERQVVVLADKGISEKLPESTWKEVVSHLVTDLKQKHLASGLTKAVEHVSKLVTPLFPAQNVNPDELTNYLIIQ